jgi:hypothetical protein
MCLYAATTEEKLRRVIAVTFLLLTVSVAHAASHGPVFGLATPTNSQGEWSFDLGAFGRTASTGAQVSARGLIAYGFTPHLTLSVTVPAVIGSATLPPTRIQPGADLDSTLAWRFHHNTTRIGTRFESTAFAGLVVPDPQANLRGVIRTNNMPGNMLGAVTGVASRSHYAWLGATFTHFYERNNNQRPNVFGYSLVYGYRPPKWRKEADKWDWRLFAELAGERSESFVQAGAKVPGSEAHQVFLGPSALGIYRNYTVSFGVQAPIYQSVGAVFPRERVRFAVNFSYLLFQHSH